MAAPFFPVQLSHTNLADWGSCVVPEGKNTGKTFKEVVQPQLFSNCPDWRSMPPFQYVEWQQSFIAYAYHMSEIHRMGALHLFHFETAATAFTVAAATAFICKASRSGSSNSFHIDILKSDALRHKHWTMLASDGRRLGRNKIQSTSSRRSGDEGNVKDNGDGMHCIVLKIPEIPHGWSNLLPMSNDLRACCRSLKITVDRSRRHTHFHLALEDLAR